jgi:hypothetical protein
MGRAHPRRDHTNLAIGDNQPLAGNASAPLPPIFRDRRGVLLVGDPPGRIAALLSNFRADPNQS